MFIQGGLLDKIQHRHLILHVQITRTLLKRTDNLIHNLTALLADLSPPSKSAAPMVHLHRTNKHNLQTLAMQIRKLLYKATDKEHFDHAWWHDWSYPTTLTALDMEELSIWVKACPQMIVLKKCVKLQTVFNEDNKELVKQSLKNGISLKKPRNRRERLNDALEMQKMEAHDAVGK